MAGRLTIRPAATDRDAVARIAPMLSAEWRHLYPEWTPASANEELLATGEEGAPPCSWLAFSTEPEEPIGSVSLVLDGEVDGGLDGGLVIDGERPGPWLANLYVVPEQRGQGVATALIDHALAHADALGVHTLWLVTDSAPDLHRRFGWVEVSPATLNGSPGVVMRRG